MANTISKKYVVGHIESNYGEMKQDPDKFVKALRDTANTYDLNKQDLFHYIIERKATIAGTQSYGFDTAYGREIRRAFEANYYNQ